MLAEAFRNAFWNTRQIIILLTLLWAVLNSDHESRIVKSRKFSHSYIFVTFCFGVSTVAVRRFAVANWSDNLIQRREYLKLMFRNSEFIKNDKVSEKLFILLLILYLMFKRAIFLSKTLPISYKRNLHLTSIKMSDKKPEIITAYDVRSIIIFTM